MDIFIEKSVEKFIKLLDEKSTAKILRSIDLLEEFNYKLGMPHCKKISKAIFELRVRGKDEIRIFYTTNKNKIILFHAFIKKSNRIPRKELELGKKKFKALT